MKRTTLVIAAILAVGLAACGEQQKPAPKPRAGREMHDLQQRLLGLQLHR